MRKIKSVKLKNDYRSSVHYATKGTNLNLEETEEHGMVWTLNAFHRFSESNVRNNQTDLFEIEYEEERKYIDVRIECDSIYCFPDEDIIKELCEQFRIKNVKVTKLAEGKL